LVTLYEFLFELETFYETKRVGFVGKEGMEELLGGHPDWKAAYLNENSESAKVTDKYLRLLKAEEK